MRERGLFFVFATVAVACGGGPSRPTASPAAASSATAGAGQPNAAAPAAPIDQRLSAIETVLPSARVAIHVDGKHLRDAPVFTPVMSALRTLGAASSIDEWTRECGFSPIDAVDEIVLSGDERATAGVRVNVPTDKALACVRAVGKGQDATFRDQPAVRLKRWIVVASGDLLVAASDEDLLGQALARKGAGPTELAAAVALGPGEVAAVRADTDDRDVDRLDARLVATASDLALHGRLECKSERAAQAIVAQKDAIAAMITSSAASPETRALLQTVGVRQDGRSVLIDLGVHGDAAAQAQLVSTVASIAATAGRQYVAAAKGAEARATIGAIAGDLSSYAEQHGKFPPSAPPVPKEAPRGAKYQSSQSDWSGTWKTIGFAMTEPQYYSYAITTAPGGKAATVVAHGDLNGDGKTSTFEMKLDIVPNKAAKGATVQRGRIVVHDEDE